MCTCASSLATKLLKTVLRWARTGSIVIGTLGADGVERREAQRGLHDRVGVPSLSVTLGIGRPRVDGLVSRGAVAAGGQSDAEREGGAHACGL